MKMLIKVIFRSMLSLALIACVWKDTKSYWLALFMFLVFLAEEANTYMIKELIEIIKKESNHGK